jgi:tetratricopeptide (TPR) repeat protein
MRYFLLISVFVSSLTLFAACGSSEAENINTNTNSAENTANVNTSTVSANEPVPTFTDAAIALSEGNKYLDASEYDKAVEAYKQAVALDPELAPAHFQLGIAYGLVEKQEEAVEDKLPGEEDEDNSQKKSKKKVEEKKTNSEIAFENAIKAYKKIVAKDSKNDAAFYNLGRAYNKLDEDKDAQKALQTAVKLQPENGEYQTEYGMILIKLAEYDLAIRALKKAIEIDETNLRAAELLEQAEAGKKRVDFGANMIKPRINQEDSREPRSSRRSKEPDESENPEKPKETKTPQTAKSPK